MMSGFETTAELIGKAFMCVGGVISAVFALGLAAEIAAEVWIAASNKWRSILEAESLIYEYRKNRKDYLLWREQIWKDGADNG